MVSAILLFETGQNTSRVTYMYALFVEGEAALTIMVTCLYNIMQYQKHLFNDNWLYFPYYCSEQRLWVLFSNHNQYFWARMRKIMYTNVNSTFLYIKWGFLGCSLCGFVNVRFWKEQEYSRMCTIKPEERYVRFGG